MFDLCLHFPVISCILETEKGQEAMSDRKGDLDGGSAK